MPIHNLTAGVESLHTALNKTQTKREEWSNMVVPVVKSVYQKVIEKYHLAWKVEVNTQIRNAGSIALSIGKVDSGISDMSIEGMKIYEKFGGALSFVQLYNGDVEIRIIFPYIEKIAEAASGYQTIRKSAPDKIDEEFVYVQIGKFLTELVAWESGTSEEKLG